MSESDRASFAAYHVEFVVEISRCRAPLHRSTTQAHRPAADAELYSSTALQLYSSTALQLYSALHSTSSTPSLRVSGRVEAERAGARDGHLALRLADDLQLAARPSRRRQRVVRVDRLDTELRW